MALKSLSSNVKSAWSEAGGWVILVVCVFFLWSFRKLFTSVGGGVGSAAEALLAKTVADAQAKLEASQAEAQKQKDKAKVQASAGTVAGTKFSDAQLATFRADAKALAGYMRTLNTLPFIQRQFSFADEQSTFSLIKRRYSRLNLYENKPWKYKDTAKRTGVVPQPEETPGSVKNPYNYNVLAGFYDEYTDGRNLISDLRACLAAKPYSDFLKWIL
jgi:hypothetical protein